MYRVVKDFTDLKDGNHVYHAGDEYPRMGAKPNEKRIDELCSKFNKRGEILIEAVVTKEEPKETPEVVEKAEKEPVKEEKPAKKESTKKEKKSAKKEDIKEK